MKYDKLQQHLDLIYATVDCSDNWQACLQHIAQDINANSGMIGVDDLRTGSHLQRIQVGYDQALIMQLSQDLKNEDIWTQALIKQPQIGFARSEDFVPHKVLINSRIYQEALRYFDIAHATGAYIEAEGCFGTRISFQRSKTEGEYNKDEQRYLNLLLPHLQRALQLSKQLVSKQLAHAANSVHNQAPLSSYRIICDHKAKLLYTSSALEENVNLLPIAPCYAHQQLEITGINKHELSSTLASVCRKDSLGTLRTPVRYEVQHQNHTYMISIDRVVLNKALRQQLNEYQAPLDARNEPLALVTIQRKKVKTQSLSILTLSPREQSLCSYIAKGMSPKEIAELEHRSEQTITGQMKAIRQKLGVKTYMALVAQLSRAKHLMETSPLN